MEKDAGEIFRELKKDLSAYVELKLELLKLNTYERTGKVIAVLSYGVILLFLAFFAILFIFLALGFFLGDLFGSVGSGFGVVAVLYLLLIGIIVMNKGRISNKVLNVVISALTTNDDKTNATDNEQSATDTTGETDSPVVPQINTPVTHFFCIRNSAYGPITCKFKEPSSCIGVNGAAINPVKSRLFINKIIL